MSILNQSNVNTAEMPRFDDGKVNLQEMFRITAEAVVNEIMSVHADEACADGNYRNGYRERTLITCVGKLTLRIPKLRMGTYFPDDLLTRYSRVDRAMIAAVSEMITNGVSTRKVDRIANAMGINKMSASQVCHICESLDSTVQDLLERDLSEVSYPYLWLDATYMKCRNEGHVSSCALVSAIGARADGYRQLLGIDSIDTETYEGWHSFLLNLKKRGVSGVICTVSDAHEGLRKAIEEVFPGSAWQRCIVHLERNATACASTRQKRAAIGAILHAVFAERDPNLVRELYHIACEKIADICPKAATLLENAEPDALAYLDFPYEHHIRLRTNNVQERTNRELKRRSRVVQVFPSRKSLIRMIGAVFAEIEENWMQKRWFSQESIAKATERTSCKAPAKSYLGGVHEHAKRILEVILANGKEAA